MPMLVQKLEAKGVSTNMRINILASLHALPPSPPDLRVLAIMRF